MLEEGFKSMGIIIENNQIILRIFNLLRKNNIQDFKFVRDYVEQNFPDMINAILTNDFVDHLEESIIEDNSNCGEAEDSDVDPDDPPPPNIDEEFEDPDVDPDDPPPPNIGEEFEDPDVDPDDPPPMDNEISLDMLEEGFKSMDIIIDGSVETKKILLRIFALLRKNNIRDFKFVREIVEQNFPNMKYEFLTDDFVNDLEDNINSNPPPSKISKPGSRKEKRNAKIKQKKSTKKENKGGNGKLKKSSNSNSSKKEKKGGNKKLKKCRNSNFNKKEKKDTNKIQKKHNDLGGLLQIYNIKYR